MDQTPATRFVDVLGRLGYKTQQQIADLLDIARPTAGTIVRYEKPPSFESIAKLKEIHPEVNMEWIFTGNGSCFVTGEDVPARHIKLRAEVEEVPEMTATVNTDEYYHLYHGLLALVKAGFFGSPEQLLNRLPKKARASADAATLYDTVDNIAAEMLQDRPGYREIGFEQAGRMVALGA